MVSYTITYFDIRYKYPLLVPSPQTFNKLFDSLRFNRAIFEWDMLWLGFIFVVSVCFVHSVTPAVLLDEGNDDLLRLINWLCTETQTTQ